MKHFIKLILILVPVAAGLIAIFFFLDSKHFKKSDKVDFNADIRPILSDKCYACHGPDKAKRESGLRLDIAEEALAHLKDRVNEFAIVPGDVEASMLVYRIFSDDPDEQMPPPGFNVVLTEREKELLKQWIAEGAEFEPHWSFVKPKMNNIPNLESEWVRNDIDRYVLKKLELMGLAPGNSSEPQRLLKRLSFDLIGLPPTIELQDRFLASPTDETYEAIIDELMGNKHFGEKWAMPWLDVARYADSHGYQDDGLRTMWPWRDWVIHAFNENYPYDVFVKMQLAGDLMPNPSREDLLATGFNRNHKITQEGGVIDEEYRIEYVTDRTNTFGKTFLGMTFECAKCHDHKYDPISQKEYFKTFAFFDQVPEKGLFGTIDASFADPPNMEITNEVAKKDLPFLNIKDQSSVKVMVMKDSINIRNTYVLARGNYDAKAEMVRPGTPEKLMPFDSTQFPSNRLGLAEWLLSEDNPLTARVFVNRIWQEIFGKGIVATSGDFGMQGQMPSHPELLDALAIRFRQNGWDTKALIKEIVMSATYRQSAKIEKKNKVIDPDNTYLSSGPRNRLSAELIRDLVLASSGLLNEEIGGPSVKPYQPEGLWESATSGRGTLQKYIQDEGKDLYRRGMYTFIKRTVPPPAMLVFDASNRDQCEVRRLKTNTPLQALIMLNDPTVLEASRALADIELKQNGIEAKITDGFRRIICRKPTDEEFRILENYYQQLVVDFRADRASAIAFLNSGNAQITSEADGNFEERAALMQLINTIFNMEEAIVKS